MPEGAVDLPPKARHHRVSQGPVQRQVFRAMNPAISAVSRFATAACGAIRRLHS